MKNLTKTINIILIIAGIVFGTIQIQANQPTKSSNSTYKLEKGYTDKAPRGKGFFSNILGKANFAHIEDSDLSTQSVKANIERLLLLLNTDKLSIKGMRQLCAYNVLIANFPSRGSNDIRSKYDRDGILAVFGPLPDSDSPPTIIRCWAYFPPVVRSKERPNCKGIIFEAGSECQKRSFTNKGDWYYADLPACQGEYTDYTIDKKTKEITKEEQKTNSFDPKALKKNSILSSYACLSGKEALENKRTLYGTKIQQIIKNPLGAYLEALSKSSTIEPDSPLAKVGVILQGLQKPQDDEE
jgi:hypothetical protein